MDDHKIKEITIPPEKTIREAMIQLNKTSKKCLFITEKDVLVGSLTDGDVRRSILSGMSLDEKIDKIVNRKPYYIKNGKRARDESIELMKEKKIEVIPILDDSFKIINYYTWEDLFETKYRNKINVPVIIMAGGVGSRLEPFTKVLPKPLIPIENKPIVEHIIDRFTEQGVNQFWMTLNYKSRVIKAYFQEQALSYKLNFIEEDEPKGTAGGLQYLKETIKTPFFVTNCDTIINHEYFTILDFHKKNNHAITLVGSAIHYQIPYGSCVLNGDGHLSEIIEKPSYDFIVNTGTYILNPEMLDLIPQKGLFHMTHLIEKTLDRGLSVGVYPISGDEWIDIGQWKEYHNALDKLKTTNII